MGSTASLASAGSTCQPCHAKQVEAYARTPMGSSFGPATPAPPAAFTHAESNTRFGVLTRNGRMFQRAERNGLVAEHPVEYRIGRGNHATGYLVRASSASSFSAKAKRLTRERYWRKQKHSNPESSEVRFQLASALRQLNEPGLASAELKVVQAQESKSASAAAAGTVADQANKELLTGDPRRALTAYQESLRLDPKNAKTHLNIALAHARLNDRAAERRSLEQALAIDPRFAAAHHRLGRHWFHSSDWARAEASFRQAVELDPQSAEAHTDLGVLLGGQSRFAEAEQHFRSSTELDPTSGFAFLNLGLMRASQQRFAEAFRDIAQAQRLLPGNPRVLRSLGMVAARLNRWKEAVALFAKVVALEPQSAEAHLNLGIARADQFDLPAARASFAEAVRLAPQSPAAEYNLGRALFDLREYEAAQTHLELALKLDPHSDPATYLLAFTHKHLERPKETIALLDRLLARQPNDQDALFLLGQSCVQSGDRPRAAQAWQKLLQLNSEHQEALYALSRLLQSTNPEQAAEYRQKIANLQQSRQIAEQAETMANFGLSAAQSRDWPRALERLNEAITLCGDCRARADLYKNLGLTQARSGDFVNAEASLRRAREWKPGDIDIVRALEMLRARAAPQPPGK